LERSATLLALTLRICRWVRTGDEVEFDAEGNIYIVDRLKVA
jgi:long-subunit acyl-CoA synthetase (AMP-forming)